MSESYGNRSAAERIFLLKPGLTSPSYTLVLWKTWERDQLWHSLKHFEVFLCQILGKSWRFIKKINKNKRAKGSIPRRVRNIITGLRKWRKDPCENKLQCVMWFFKALWDMKGVRALAFREIMKTRVIAIEFPVHHKVAAFTEVHLDVLACVDPGLVLSDRPSHQLCDHFPLINYI